MTKTITPVAKDSKDSKKAKVAKPAVKKVTAATLRKLATGVKKANDVLAPLPTTPILMTEAAKGIAAARALLGTENITVGKVTYSPLGHKVGFQAGEFDLAILTCTEPDFGEWVKQVAKANCKSRKSDLTDNAALIKRLGSHFRTLSGLKGNNLRRALKRINKEALHDEIAGFMSPVCVLFQDHASAVKF